MRRPILVFALALLAAAALSASAFAKEGGVELSSTPSALGPGDPWTPSLTLIDIDGQLPANAKPGIKITNLETGRTIDYPATPTDNPAVYTVRVVFPAAGRWDYAAYDGVTDRLYEFPTTRIVAPNGTIAATPKAAAIPALACPRWPWRRGASGSGRLRGDPQPEVRSLGGPRQDRRRAASAALRS
jgi:hypothetical protein